MDQDIETGSKTGIYSPSHLARVIDAELEVAARLRRRVAELEVEVAALRAEIEPVRAQAAAIAATRARFPSRHDAQAKAKAATP